jgi:hypothetical protein
MFCQNNLNSNKKPVHVPIKATKADKPITRMLEWSLDLPTSTLIKGTVMSTRRQFLLHTIPAAITIGAVGNVLAADNHLDEASPVATALGYKHDASKVDAKKNPNWAAGKVCGGCALFQGKAGDAWGPCAAISGKEVNAKGWCKAFAKKA